MTPGDYNQDLGPRMILLEFGAHTNYLEHAQQAAEFFAKVIPAAAGIEPGQAQAADKEIGAPAGRSVFWILGIAAAVLIVYLVINRQGLGSITSFFRREAGLGGTMTTILVRRMGNGIPFTLVLGALADFWRVVHAASGLSAVSELPAGLGNSPLPWVYWGLIGAVIVPALMERFFRSFLSAVSYRSFEVRNMERNTLTAMEATEMVGRGSGYIEGIARFEARNYLAIWVALAAAVVSQLFDPNRPLQIVGGFIVNRLAWVLNRLMQGSVIGEIADVELAELGLTDRCSR